MGLMCLDKGLQVEQFGEEGRGEREAQGQLLVVEAVGEDVVKVQVAHVAAEDVGDDGLDVDGGLAPQLLAPLAQEEHVRGEVGGAARLLRVAGTARASRPAGRGWRDELGGGELAGHESLGRRHQQRVPRGEDHLLQLAVLQELARQRQVLVERQGGPADTKMHAPPPAPPAI